MTSGNFTLQDSKVDKDNLVVNVPVFITKY